MADSVETGSSSAEAAPISSETLEESYATEAAPISSETLEETILDDDEEEVLEDEEVEEEIFEEDEEEILEDDEEYEDHVEEAVDEEQPEDHGAADEAQEEAEDEAGKTPEAVTPVKMEDKDIDIESPSTPTPVPKVAPRSSPLDESDTPTKPQIEGDGSNSCITFVACIAFIAALIAAIAIPLGLRRYGGDGGGKTFRTTSGPDPLAPPSSSAPVQPPTMAPVVAPTTPAPTSVNFNQFLSEFLIPRFGEEPFQDKDSATFKAADFLANNDPFIFDGPVTSEAQLGDRYATVVMYYSLGGESWQENNWLVGDHCNWTGIESCNSVGRVTSIVMSSDIIGSQITGTIPSDVSLFTELEELTIENENIAGPIPSALPAALVKLNLGGNSLTGFVPDELLTLSELTVLDLSSNNLSGLLPQSFGQLISIENISLDGNGFAGTVPSSFGSLNNLVALTLQENEITGTIPGELCDLGLATLTADCISEVACDCCSSCF